MLARLERELPRDGYLYEPKWDGFRCLVFREGDDVDLRSRHDRPLARYFPEVVEGVLRVPEQRFALDGELLARRDGVLDFPSLLGRIHPAASRVERLRREAPAALVAFDVLSVGEDDIRGRPFLERRELLDELLRDVPAPLEVTPLTDDRAIAERWLEAGAGTGIDGVVAKHRDLLYEPGARRMIKIKRERTADCVVAGFRWLVDRPGVASLLLGLYDDAGDLHHVGVVTSFRESLRRELAEELLPLAVPLEEHPWAQGYSLAGGTTGRLRGAAGRWTPEMELDWVPLAVVRVCEVGYDQVDARRFRHPARLVRWRPDRDPRSCTLEQLDVPVHEPAAPAHVSVPLTNLDRVLWPETGFTKGDLVAYYRAVARVLLPHLRDRPLTLWRYPSGVHRRGWWQNECRGAPSWLRTASLRGQRFCVAEDERALVWLANQGVVELHPFPFRIGAPDRPLALVLDLDPGAPAGLDACREVALLLRDRLRDAQAKTSGRGGIHVLAPAPPSFVEAKERARRLAEDLAAERPDLVTAVQRRHERRGKVLVDWLQNDPTRSTVAPYSLRGARRPFVSTPVTWDEVERGELVFEAADVLDRVDRLGDLLAAYTAVS